MCGLRDFQHSPGAPNPTTSSSFLRVINLIGKIMKICIYGLSSKPTCINLYIMPKLRVVKEEHFKGSSEVMQMVFWVYLGTGTSVYLIHLTVITSLLLQGALI